jgi:hypothetical protein
MTPTKNAIDDLSYKILGAAIEVIDIWDQVFWRAFTKNVWQ